MSVINILPNELGYRNNLLFLYEENHGTYPNETIVKVEAKNYNEFIGGMLLNITTKNLTIDGKPMFNHYISSRIEESVFSSHETYLMTVDCDGDTRPAEKVLLENGIKHSIVQSSPGRHWIFCDFIAPMSSIIPLMKRLPGADEKYIKYAEMQGKLVLRAFPKNGCLPDFSNVDIKKINFQLIFMIVSCMICIVTGIAVK